MGICRDGWGCRRTYWASGLRFRVYGLGLSLQGFGGLPLNRLIWNRIQCIQAFMGHRQQSTPGSLQVLH